MSKKNPIRRGFTAFHKIGAGLLLFFLLTLIGARIFLRQTSVGSPKFIPNTMLLLGLTALVVVIILVLGFVLARNVVKLYFEHRSKLLGSRFKTRLLVAFGALSLAPAVLQIFLAEGLSRSIDQWFSAPSRQMLENSVALADIYYRELASRAAGFARSLAQPLQARIAGPQAAAPDAQELDRLLSSLLAELPEARVRIYDGAGRPLYRSSTEFESPADHVQRALHTALAGGVYNQAKTDALVYDLILCAVPLHSAAGVAGAVLVERFVPDSAAFMAYNVREAHEKYTELEARNFEYRWTYMLVLTLATVMILFGLSWFAIYVAKRITVPIQALAEGAEQVAAGRLDYRVRCETSDEVQNLVESFNHMIEELEENRRQIDATHRALQKTHLESEERRRYTETLLENIPSCVISTDADFRVTTVNRAATEILQIRKEQTIGQLLHEAVDPGLAVSLKGLAQRALFSGQAVREIEWSTGRTVLHLAASLNYLRDAEGRIGGSIILLDDLTELINAEKLAAWQEVARRLAHEIRNPLTPIQLSAERIRRQAGLKGGGPVNSDAGREPYDAHVKGILDESTQLIIQEARSLKRLVEEFSRFARMPAHRPGPADVNQVIESALLLYEGRIGGVRVVRTLEPNLPTLMLDTEQMKRVFVNLFDNALAAMSGAGDDPQLSISTRWQRRQNRVRVEVADTGSGISKADRDNLFLPYFSRRKKGTGLGLTIVRQIVTDHEGRIRAEDNKPRGARLILDLPIPASEGTAREASLAGTAQVREG